MYKNKIIRKQNKIKLETCYEPSKHGTSPPGISSGTFQKRHAKASEIIIHPWAGRFSRWLDMARVPCS